MLFSAPLYLLILLPWLAAAYWLLRGRAAVATVPFVALWRGTAVHTTPTRAIRMPPRAVLALLAASLIAILSSAAPVFTGFKDGPLVTVIVDRGIHAERTADWNALLTEAEQNIRQVAGSSGPVDVVTVPPEEVTRSDRANWRRVAANSRFDPHDGAAATRDAAREALSRESALVVVVTPAQVNLRDPRLVHLTPHQPAENVAITQMSFRSAETSQLMVTVDNRSARPAATLLVESAGTDQRRTIQLPPPGERRNYFIDLPAPGADIHARLLEEDAVVSDNDFWLARRPGRRKLEMAGDVPPAVARMVDVHSAQRPGDTQAGAAIISGGAAGLDPSLPAAIIGSGGGRADPESTHVIDHPVTNAVPWKVVLSDATIADLPPGDWTSLVSAGGRIAVAFSETPVRRIFVGIDSDRWHREASFVVFWAQVFDWLAESGGAAYDSLPLSPRFPPGLHAAGGNTFVAMNVDPPVSRFHLERKKVAAGDETAGFAQISRLPNADLPAAPVLLVAASLFILVAAVYSLPPRVAPSKS